jgi:O-acetyl-ADP-ribose deacetylase (regulator of RNase III)
MSIEFVTGDLFALTTGENRVGALAHGVNCRGVMGSGIAPIFKARWPEMYEQYRHECARGDLTLGGMFAWQTPGGRWIYNLASQDRPGADARLDAVESSVKAALVHAEMFEVDSIAMPRIGAGIGGLDWSDVKALLVDLATEWSTRLVVVSLPGAPA